MIDSCSFCYKTAKETPLLVRADEACICYECTMICLRIFMHHRQQASDREEQRKESERLIPFGP